MPFPIPTFDESRASLLRDYQALLPDAAVGVDSDFFVRASALAAANEGLYQHQSWIFRQLFPDTADSLNLDRHATWHNLSRKQANVSTGFCTVSGVADSVVTLGAQLVDAAGVQFVATATITLDVSGAGSLPIMAASAGVAGNLPVSAVLSFIAAPVGVQSSATITALSGGTNMESDAELAIRILDEIRNPPSGGSVADYKRWAKEVPGVTDAYVFPARRGGGTVDVAIETLGGIPSDALVLAVQTHINMVKPVTADVLVIKPMTIAVDVNAILTLLGITYADAVIKVNAVLSDYFNRLQVGEPVYLNRLVALMMEVVGVVNVVIVAPTTDVYPRTDATAVELAILGTVSLF
ncbi:MAG: baseplate J/gp47 family protein [Gallionella sp.]|nr:baseplate J/gp47 family protein [Gallionella sp.]